MMDRQTMQSLLSRLPGVDQLLEDPGLSEITGAMPRSVVVEAVRRSLDEIRGSIRSGAAEDGETLLERPALIARIVRTAERLHRPNFTRVVNASGVIVHTNLGRSLLAEEALAAVAEAGRHYNNLEFDLSSGRRGTRYSHVEGLLCELTGAESALVVNNNAAAVLICLETLAHGREVIVSRGELVEIGGAFRIPDVMARSGARLVEVGTTNKTHPSDYERAIGPDTALLLKVHQSNFRIVGFSQLVDVTEVTALAGAHGLPVMEDLGSGSLIDFSRYGLRREPTVAESVAAGVDVVTFSGDKLLGGPQAGIILGRRDMVDRIKKNPINRAMRIDKFTLAALEATLRLYRDEAAAVEKIPTLRLITLDYQHIRRRAARLKRRLAAAAGDWIDFGLEDGHSRIGGGALPEEGPRTRLISLRPRTMSVNALEERLRGWSPPIIARIEHDAVLFDPRTIHERDAVVVEAALAALGNKERP